MPILKPANIARKQLGKNRKTSIGTKSLFKRPKNMKNFFDRVKEVANCVISVKDYKDGKEIKVLQ